MSLFIIPEPKKIQPEHVRKAHVNAYASEIKFKLGVMVAILIAVVLFS